jgi:hypothetical protein
MLSDSLVQAAQIGEQLSLHGSDWINEVALPPCPIHLTKAEKAAKIGPHPLSCQWLSIKGPRSNARTT